MRFDPTKRSTFPKIGHGTRILHLKSDERFYFMGYFRTVATENEPDKWFVALVGWGDHMRILCPIEQFTVDRWDIIPHETKKRKW